MDENAMFVTREKLAPMDEEEKTLLDVALGGAETMFSQLGEFPATIIAVTKGTKQLEVAPLSGREKAYVNAVMDHFEAKGAMWVYAAEAYIRIYTATPDTDPQQFVKELVLRPQDDPARVEVLMVNFHNGERVVQGQAKILRPAGQPPKLAPWQFMDSGLSGHRVERTNLGDGSERLSSGPV